jgi:hypothetical protein
VKRLLPVILLPLLAACADGAVLPPFLGGEAPVAEPEGPPPVPEAVVPYLPPNVPGTVVMQDANGCYLFSVEVTDPPSGFPVRDGAGNPVCEGVAAAPPAPVP